MSLFALQQIDEINCVVEAHALALMDRGHTEGNGQMGFAGTGAADQNQVVGCFQIIAASQVLNTCRIDGRFGKIKPGEISMQREARGL